MNNRRYTSLPPAVTVPLAVVLLLLPAAAIAQDSAGPTVSSVPEPSQAPAGDASTVGDGATAASDPDESIATEEVGQSVSDTSPAVSEEPDSDRPRSSRPEDTSADRAAAGGTTEPAPVQTSDESADTGESAPDTSLIPLEVTGSFFTRYELREGYERIGIVGPRFREMDAVAYRARLGLATVPQRVSDGLEALVRFTPQASGFWQAGGLNDAELGLHEGYLRLQSCGARFDAGRFEMAYGEHLVIGNVGWHQTGRSFDGARLRLGTKPARAWVDLVFTVSSEGLPALYEPIGAGDLYFTGVYAGVGPLLGEKLELDLYALTHIWPGTDVPESAPGAGDGGEREAAAELTLGSRVKTRVGIVDLRAEGGVQLGARRAAPDQVAEAVSTLAFQIDGEVGLNLADERLRIAGGGLYASGDDPDTADKNEAYNQLYPTAHRWLGFADIMGGRSNVAGPIARAALRLPYEIKLAVDGHFFFRPADRTTTAPDGTTSTAESSYAATEIDTSLGYGLGKGLILRGMYALFLPASEQYPSTDPVHFFEVELRYNIT